MRSMSTSKTRTIITGAAALAVTAGVALTTAGAASAATLPAKPLPRVAAGSVELGSPLQYEKFLAIQRGPFHGGVNYTNWTYAEPGSGVWVPAGETSPSQTTSPEALVFNYLGTPYAHTLNGGLKLTANSPDKLSFTGKYNPGSPTWTISGQIKDSKVSFEIKYDGSTYTVDAVGTIASDGSASGTAMSSTSQALTWKMGAGSFVSVLHFTAPVQSAHVNTSARNATFRFTVPVSVPGLGGTSVTVWVHDGNLPGNGGDTYAHGVTSYPPAPTNYPVIGGPGISIP
jgi:hypothetical protein